MTEDEYNDLYDAMQESLFQSLMGKPMIPRPKYCQADRDGDCTNLGCPQKKDWKPICPQPEYPEEG